MKYFCNFVKKILNKNHFPTQNDTKILTCKGCGEQLKYIILRNNFYSKTCLSKHLARVYN